MSESGQEALPDVREWSVNPTGCLGSPRGCPGVFRRPTWMSGRPSRMS